VTDSYELAEYLGIERKIGAPVREVWPIFLDMNRWYTDYHWDWISGPSYEGIGLQEGQVLKATPSETIIADLIALFHQSWNKSLDNLEALVCNSAGTRTSGRSTHET
jgi:hypothetical protein